MKLKDYQKRTLAVVREFLEHLAEARAKNERAREVDPELMFDFAQRAWEKTDVGRIYQPRRNGLGEPLPSFCLKVPTGGGKTLLATKTLDAINTHYRRKQTGLVLWVVPTTQIYRQTFQALKDRDHPYRQMLDMASAGRTLILERANAFLPSDVEENLCVLMLMLPAAARESKDQLRMFRDSGGYDRFFPRDDDFAGHKALLERIPNLDTFEREAGFWGRQIKTSLGNTLRLLQPVIILDEGQKAYSPLARKTLEGFNPCLLVELSATPPKEANALVSISGKELKDEEMVKLDVHIRNRSEPNWRDTLLASIEHRDALERAAREYEAQTGVYIRPICLIQVERTGKDQRGPGIIHADDARDYLVETHGIAAERIAIKTSQKDELKEVDEAGGLLARDCPIRYIITKQALQEGWDCPFAYVLTVLTNPSSQTALTQLVGRILRQPFAKKTGIPLLDESYVYCFQRRGVELMQEIRRGFGLEGLGDLEGRVVLDGAGGAAGKEQIFEPRERFRKAARDLVLPAFMIRDGAHWRLVHYEADILSRVPWGDVDVSPVFDLTLNESTGRDVEITAGIDERIMAEEGLAAFSDADAQAPDSTLAAGHLLDVIPNPWRGTELARRVFERLEARYGRAMVRGNYVFILEEMRKRLEAERDRLAEDVFRELLKLGQMRFMVVTDDLEPAGLRNQLPRKIVAKAGEKRATRESGRQFELSLFEHVAEDGLNEWELKVATYLDEQDRLFFWYRNLPRRDYHVQGWRRGRIFADFLFTTVGSDAANDGPIQKVFVVETKGLHLKKHSDTEYKRSVFDLCTKHATERDWVEFAPTMADKRMRFEIVDQDEWQNRLNELLA